MAQGLMLDAEWTFFEPFLRAVRAPQGRRGGDHRRVQGGVFWIARTGSAWRDLSEGCGQVVQRPPSGPALGEPSRRRAFETDGERPDCARRS